MTDDVSEKIAELKERLSAQSKEIAELEEIWHKAAGRKPRFDIAGKTSDLETGLVICILLRFHDGRTLWVNPEEFLADYCLPAPRQR